MPISSQHTLDAACLSKVASGDSAATPNLALDSLHPPATPQLIDLSFFEQRGIFSLSTTDFRAAKTHFDGQCNPHSPTIAIRV